MNLKTNTVTKDLILRYIEDHFHEDDFKVKGEIIQLNSPFKNDTKFHLGIALSEEKLGLWNDFKPPQDSGDFIKFVSLMKDISKQEAQMYLIDNYMQYMNLSKTTIEQIKESGNDDEYHYKQIEIPSYTAPIFNKGNTSGLYSKGFLGFLMREKRIKPEVIEEHNIMYCYDGKYANCFIIPFYNNQDQIVYWQAVKLSNGQKFNCPNSIAKGKGSGIAYNIYTKEEHVVLVESVWDALRIPKHGIALLSNKITAKQIEMLFMYPRKEIILLMDNYTNDKAGSESVNKNLDMIALFIRTNKIDTVLKLFLWNGAYFEYKDLTRCDFDIEIEDLRKHCTIYGKDESAEFKMELMKNLF